MPPLKNSTEDTFSDNQVDVDDYVITSEIKHNLGFTIQTRQYGWGDMDVCLNDSGDYIGVLKDALHLYKMGIKPELRDENSKVCSVGFCDKENKWYGWSHRAIYGFGVGSEVKFGDCAYTPKDLEDARQCALNFWQDEHYENMNAVLAKDRDGKDCFNITWTYKDSVPNEDLRSKITGLRDYPPSIFGKGQWVAKTLDDARQMACDFAEGVS